MQYISTRDTTQCVSASRTILQGISAEGGLFVPQQIPTITPEELSRLCRMDYGARAEAILAKYLGDFSAGEIAACVRAAYGGERFEGGLPAPLSRLCDDTYVLELWHGPTCAFKDMALQMLPHLLRLSAQKQGEEDEVVILVATSGDTGKAALEGFRDAPGTRILVFYPEDGVSGMQKLQMRAQEGDNVTVCAIRGNFDDAQTGVKRLFTSEALGQRLRGAGKCFSSANSINWGRLLPQIVYYVSAYCDLVQDEEIALGDRVNFAVPTGNFGNILAAYYAKRMGLPVGKLICASNRNNVLTDFIETGVYDRNRGFYPSLSPSMDILISSNLERLLFELCGRDAQTVRGLMDALHTTGRYAISPAMRAGLAADFAAGFCSDEGTREVIASVFGQYSYLLDTHTAVAFSVCAGYRAETADETRTVVVSTASAYKFADSVCAALEIPHGHGVFDPLDTLLAHTGVPIPAPICALRQKNVRFSDVIEKADMERYVEEKLGL